MNENQTLDLNRIARLSGTDEGFFLLALHSFIEGLANSIKPNFTLYSSFNDVIDLLMEHLEKQNQLTSGVRKSLIRLAKQHQLTHNVRHRFDTVTQDDVAAALSNFREICRAFSLESPALAMIDEGLSLWKEGKPPVALAKELKHARSRLSKLETDWTQAQVGVMALGNLQRQLKEAESLIANQRSEMEQIRLTSDHRDEKNTELRSRLRKALTARDAILAEMDKYRSLEDYIGYLERFTTYTRTRSDYERSVMELTAEQEDAVSLVRAAGDYVIKGAAGTGKTLVLLHALERYLNPGKMGDVPIPGGRVVLLTYTNTLVKYSRYLAEVVGRNSTVPLVSTADAFILDVLRRIQPHAAIDFKAPGNFIKEYNTTSFLSDEELTIELEEVIWGNMLSRQEYIEKHILRKGMKQPLSSAQRMVVWDIQERLRSFLTAQHRYTKNLACDLIIKHIEATETQGIGVAERIFVDEAQDLSTAAVRALALLSNRGLVLAADDGQSIYRIGSQYLSAGLKVTGHVRILKTNFRNTKQIRDLAEELLAMGQSSPDSAGDEPRARQAYREGPEPELVQAASPERLMDALVHQVDFCCTRLGYAPENIGVIAPTNTNLEAIKNRLGHTGLAAANIKDEGFDFSKPGVVRLSTLYSAKGLEFPVVLLYVPISGLVSVCDEKTKLSMQRNLLYVALTRAMDQVVVFALEKPEEGIINELARLIQATHAE